jgi:hypothetical protein
MSPQKHASTASTVLAVASVVVAIAVLYLPLLLG